MTMQQKARAARMLRAFDGMRAGATQQEIASVLLRLDPLERDAWQDSSARHAIKALLRDARGHDRGRQAMCAYCGVFRATEGGLRPQA
jgi:hypothetical protein